MTGEVNNTDYLLFMAPVVGWDTSGGIVGSLNRQILPVRSFLLDQMFLSVLNFHIMTPVVSAGSSQPMKPLKAAATTSQPVLTLAQIETIFFKVPELYEIHKEFYDGLLPRVQQWSHHQRVGDLFQKLVRNKKWEVKGEREFEVVVCVWPSPQSLGVAARCYSLSKWQRWASRSWQY